jgi:hypothetical protein
MASSLSRTALLIPLTSMAALGACSNPQGVGPDYSQYLPPSPGGPSPGPASAGPPATTPPSSSQPVPPPPAPVDAGGVWHPDASRQADSWQADSWKWEPDTSPAPADATLAPPDTSTPAPSPPPDAAPPPAPDAGVANTCASPTCGIDGLGNCGCTATADGQGYFLNCQNDGQCECLTGNNNNNQNNFFFDDQACFSEATIQQLFIQACQCP